MSSTFDKTTEGSSVAIIIFWSIPSAVSVSRKWKGYSTLLIFQKRIKEHFTNFNYSYYYLPETSSVTKITHIIIRHTCVILCTYSSWNTTLCEVFRSCPDTVATIWSNPTITYEKGKGINPTSCCIYTTMTGVFIWNGKKIAFESFISNCIWDFGLVEHLLKP